MRARHDNPSRKRRMHGVVLLLLLAAVSAATSAQPEIIGPTGITGEATTAVRRVLVDDEGRRRTVEIVGVKDNALQTRDLSGRPRSVPLSSVVAMFPAIEDGIAKTTVAWADLLNLDGMSVGQLYLTDGQSIPGHPAPSAGTPDRVDWVASGPRLRGTKFTVPLDRVAAVKLGGSTGTPTVSRVKDVPTRLLDTQPAKDTIVFANGDRSEGFVSSIGEVVSIEAGSKTSNFPSTRIDYVRLANPSVRLPGPCVWLADGSVLAIQSPRGTEDGALSAAIRDAVGTPTTLWTWKDITAYTTDAARITPLAALKPKLIANASDRWAKSPQIGDIASAPLGAAEIEFPSPMGVEWQLTNPARRLSMRMILPESSRRWGDAVVVIELGTSPVRELARERLNGDRPMVEVNAALDAPKGAVLRIRLEAGENGPVQDRVLLRQAIVINDAGK